jgi:hypothetical protein
MTTLIHGETRRFTLESREGNKDYDARIIVGFGIAMITVVITAYAIAASSGVDASNLQLMSSFP